MRSTAAARFLTPLVLGITGALAALFLFERLADEVLEGETLQFDGAIRSVLHGFASPRLTEFMRLLSDIGDVTAVFVLSLTACIVLWIMHRRPASILLAASVGGAVGLMWGLKLLFHRARPAPYFGIPVPPDYSFPSGHALVAFCFYGVVATMFSSEWKAPGARAATWIAASAMAFGIGLSRIYLGVHYPSDVLGGYLAGAVWVSAVSVVYRRFRSPEA